MKNKITLQIAFYFSFFIFHSSSSIGQSWLWGREGYGSIKTNDYASPVATDKTGNAYITGQYTPTVIFGNDTLNTLTENAYLTKYNSAGNVIWAKQIIDSTGSSFGTSVATDKLGNMYITGFFSGKAYLDTFQLKIKRRNSSLFLAKYNPAGKVLWAKQSEDVATSSSDGVGYSVATDNLDNVYMTGYFNDTVTFGNDTLKCVESNENVFLVKYDSTGNVLWARQSKTDSASLYGSVGYSVTADGLGNSYVTGYFYDTISFGATTLINNYSPSYCGFLVKYSPSGNVLWAKQTLNGSISSMCNPYAVITDKSGYPYITGYFEDIVKFGPLQLFSPSTYSIFLTKYDASGNPIWAKQSSAGWEGTGLATDGSNRIYIAGFSTQNPDSLRFGNYALALSPWAQNASFVMKFDTSGYPLCGSILNNLGDDYALNGIASDLTGTYIYTASVFMDTVFCGADTLLPRGSQDIFVGRWQSCEGEEQGINPISTPNAGVLVYPNPNDGVFQLGIRNYELGINTIEIYNLLGEKVYSTPLPQTPKGALNTINLSSQPQGVYLYRVIAADGSLLGEGKLIIQR